MIYRSEHKSGYTRISNAILRDTTLSEGARSLLVFMLSMSDKWDFSVKGLALMTGTAERRVMQLVTELKKAGYISQRRTQNEKGQFTACLWDVWETPQPIVQKNHSVDKPQCGETTVRSKPQCGKTTPIRTIKYKEQSNIKERTMGKKDTAEKCQLGRYENVFLTNAEQEELCNRYSLETLVEYIDRLSGYIHDHPGKKYKNHKATIEKWINEDEGREAT